jgi:hypothetical protein
MGTSAQLAGNAQTLINIATSTINSFTLTGSNVTLTARQLDTEIISFNGTLTANVVVTIPTAGQWTFYNGTSGAFTVSLTNGSGASLVIAQGSATSALSNGGSGVLSTGSSSGGGTTGVSSFNTRSGAVTLTAADVTSVGAALLSSPAFTGTPTGPTAGSGTNTTQLATTAFVGTALAGYAPTASPTFTGTPVAPTATPGANNTQIATTAFVDAAGVSGFDGFAYCANGHVVFG